jgi:hypothetical protein
MKPTRRTVLILFAVLAAFASAQEPTVVRLRDAVGDTIDRAERDSFHLFPNTAGFRYAVILSLPGSRLFAKVAQADGDTLVPVYYRIQPGQLDRIRFLIDYREFVAEQQKSDMTMAPSLKSFWQGVEGRPLRDIVGALAEPGSSDAPWKVGEYEYHATVLGATAGSTLGGCVGSWAGIDVVDHVPSTNCLGREVTVPVYSVSHPVFWTTACGITALGTAAGYVVGDRLQNSRPAALALPDEGKEWRTGCAIGGTIPGFILGAGYFLLSGPLHYGRTEFTNKARNDPAAITYLPMALTGLCIAVEVTTIGYYVGRLIDRQNAEKAEKKRRALGR